MYTVPAVVGNSRMFHSIFAMVQKEQYQKWETTLGKTRKREPEKKLLFFSLKVRAFTADAKLY